MITLASQDILEAVDDRSAASIAVMGGELAYEVLVPAFLAERLKTQLLPQ